MLGYLNHYNTTLVKVAKIGDTYIYILVVPHSVVQTSLMSSNRDSTTSRPLY